MQSVFKCAPVHSVLTRKWPNQPTRGFISWKMEQRLWKAKNSFFFGTAEILEGPYKKKHPEISCLVVRLISGSWSNIGSSSSSESSLRDTNFRFIPMILLLPDLASCENSEIIDNARKMFSTNCSWFNTSVPLQTMHLPTNSWLPAVKSVDLINSLIKELTINSR